MAVVVVVVVMIMSVCWDEQVLLFVLLVQLAEFWRGRSGLTVRLLSRDPVYKAKSTCASVNMKAAR